MVGVRMEPQRVPVSIAIPCSAMTGPRNPAIGTNVHGRSADEAALHTHAGLQGHVLIALDAAQHSRTRADVQPASGHDVCGDDVACLDLQIFIDQPAAARQGGLHGLRGNVGCFRI